MNGLTDAQRTTINSLDIGSQVSVTKSFPKSTPSTVTQLMALEGISHDITPDRHIVTLYPNPARIYTYFIVGGYATTTTRTNLVPNPSFEVTTSTWSNQGATTSARITTDSYSGVACLQITKNAARAEILLLETVPVPVVAGLTYTVSAYFKVPAGQESMNAGIRIIWYDATFTGLSGFIEGTYTSLTSADGWQRRTVTVTAPVNAAYIRTYYGQKDGGTVGQQFLLDAVLVEAASSALPYFDGRYADTYTGYTLQSQSWSGTDNSSTSTATWGLTSSLFGSQLDDDTKGLG
jgi:hypothetical protein